MNRLVIKGGRLIDPSVNVDGLFNIYIMGGRVGTIKPADRDTTELVEGAPGLEVIDATGLVVLPGFIDAHTHLREPGFEYKETIKTGTQAASSGGFTSVLCMANTNPVNDNASVTRYILDKAKAEGTASVHPIGAVTVGQLGERLTEFGDLKAAGCVAFSDDGVPITDGTVMRRALEYSKIFGAPVVSHSEDPRLAGAGVMNEGAVSTRLGLKGIPNAAEDAMVARDLSLAELTGGRLHIAHVSTRGAVELIRSAKARGVNVTAETTPHHLTLTDEAVVGYDTFTKMNPPLRAREDVDALRGGLKDGTIDCIATDHAPQSAIEKDVEFDKAANGIVGLETAFSLAYGLVEEGGLTLDAIIRALTINPSRAFSLNKGSLRVGSQADIVIVDLNRTWKVDPSRLKSKSKNTPYGGRTLKGVVIKTVVNGSVVYDATKENS
ncbi:MAG: dihydroorotase [Deltaproteobacteria bacterium GWB2_55_19]|nr:MAG: dihydroorotase [Deltaproteobacteria bacterium GWB2_55_19]HAO93798.1 dihydroorotase [Deltaproteobacteria bacterium]